jgi:hypothetical protein
VTEIVGVGNTVTSIGTLSFAYHGEAGAPIKWIIEPGDVADPGVLADAVQRGGRAVFLAGGPRNLESRLVRLGLPRGEATDLAERLWSDM